MTFEVFFGIVAVLAIFVTAMFFAFRQRNREHQKLMDAAKTGDQTTVLRGILSGAVALLGFVALIGFEEGVEGVITLFAISAVMVGLAAVAVSTARLWKHRKKRDDPSTSSKNRHGIHLLVGVILLASAVVAVGTATLVAYHGATTIIIYYVVIPPAVGLILLVRKLYRRLRRDALDKRQ